MANTVKSTLLLGLLTGLFLLIGGGLGGRAGMVMAFGFYGAQPIGEADAPVVYRIVRNLATKARIPMPRLYLLPAETPNAFATGRNPQHAAVAVTEGILRIMSEEELEGVLAHELSHVLNRDVLTSTIAATLAGAVMMLANMARWGAIFAGSRRDDDNGGGLNPIALLVTALLAPIAAMLIQMAISRSREYEADASGARLTRNPQGLASALARLEQASQAIPMDASPATAHLFIVNPLSGRAFMNLFSTHPPIEERIARLRAMRVV
ncbi:MAG: protease HtpX [Candidatus Rokuibacteriota bacterium]|nr:MAG: protease HtpX [Candidatus Rokubacteria bacterium]